MRMAGVQRDGTRGRIRRARKTPTYKNTDPQPPPEKKRERMSKNAKTSQTIISMAEPCAIRRSIAYKSVYMYRRKGTSRLSFAE